MTRLAGSVITATTPITASSENSGSGEGATNLRDDNVATKWLAFTTNTTLTYQLPTPAAVASYAFTSGNDSPNRDPRNWTLAGSNDGSSFTTIDTQTGVAAMSGRGVRASYTVPSGNVASYTYYRLNITAVNGDSITQLAEWDLAGVVVAPVYLDGWGLLDTAQGMLGSSAAYDSAVLADSPLVYWKLDETSGTSMADSSGNARNGTYSGATLAQAPLVNDAGKSALGGNSGQGVGSLASAAWMEQASFSAECWVKPNNTVAGGKSLFSRFTGGTMHWAVYQDIGKLRFLVGSTEATGPTYTVGATYHLVGTYDGATVRLYVNGSLFASAASVQSGTSGQNMQVGGHAGANYSQATVDGVAFYAGALSPARVATHYSAGLGQLGAYDSAVLADSPLGYWKLDETSGTNLADSSGNGRNGTYDAAAAVLGQPALLSDGGKSAKSLGSGANFGIGFVGNAPWMNQSVFSAECWVKAGDTRGSAGLFTRWSSSGPPSGPWLFWQNGGTINFLVTDTANSNKNLAGPAISPGTTLYLAGTYDGTTARFYVNGSLVASIATSLSANSGGHIQFDSFDGANSGNVNNAQLDSCAFYGTALSATRIAAHYAAGL